MILLALFFWVFLILLLLSPIIAGCFILKSIYDQTDTIYEIVDEDVTESVVSEESKVWFEPNSEVGRLPRNSREFKQVELARDLAHTLGELARLSAQVLSGYVIGNGLRLHFPRCQLIRSANSHQRVRASTITNETQLNVLSSSANENFIRVSDKEITVQQEPIQKIIREMVTEYLRATITKMGLNANPKAEEFIRIQVKWEFTDEEFIELCRYWLSYIEGFEDLTEDDKDEALSNFNDEQRQFTEAFVNQARAFEKPVVTYQSPTVFESPNIVIKEQTLFSRLLDTLWPSSQKQKPSQNIIR